MDAIKTELVEILLALVKGVKVLIVYIIPSLIISIIAIPDIGVVLQENPEALLPYLVNALVLALSTYAMPKVTKLQSVG